MREISDAEIRKTLERVEHLPIQAQIRSLVTALIELREENAALRAKLREEKSLP